MQWDEESGALLVTGGLSLGEKLSLSVPQFPHLQRRHNRIYSGVENT